MTQLADFDIRNYALNHGMITPFSEAHDGGVISYGLTSAGYDLMLANELLVFRNDDGRRVIDPKADMGHILHSVYPIEGRFYLPPHSYVLGRSFEYIRMPKTLKGRCVGKSTYARCGILINTTPLEPGWEGHLTIEIGNVTPCTAVIYAMEGIAQLEFETILSEPEVTYDAKKGKYQGQTGITPARVK